jgi:hypothetical protein
MLFVRVLEGKSLSVEVCELGLCAVCSYMAGNTGRGIYGSFIGILGDG